MRVELSFLLVIVAMMVTSLEGVTCASRGNGRGSAASTRNGARGGGGSTSQAGRGKATTTQGGSSRGKSTTDTNKTPKYMIAKQQREEEQRRREEEERLKSDAEAKKAAEELERKREEARLALQKERELEQQAEAKRAADQSAARRTRAEERAAKAAQAAAAKQAAFVWDEPDLEGSMEDAAQDPGHLDLDKKARSDQRFSWGHAKFLAQYDSRTGMYRIFSALRKLLEDLKNEDERLQSTATRAGDERGVIRAAKEALRKCVTILTSIPAQAKFLAMPIKSLEVLVGELRVFANADAKPFHSRKHVQPFVTHLPAYLRLISGVRLFLSDSTFLARTQADFEKAIKELPSALLSEGSDPLAELEQQQAVLARILKLDERDMSKLFVQLATYVADGKRGTEPLLDYLSMFADHRVAVVQLFQEHVAPSLTDMAVTQDTVAKLALETESMKARLQRRLDDCLAAFKASIQLDYEAHGADLESLHAITKARSHARSEAKSVQEGRVAALQALDQQREEAAALTADLRQQLQQLMDKPVIGPLPFQPGLVAPEPSVSYKAVVTAAPLSFGAATSKSTSSSTTAAPGAAAAVVVVNPSSSTSSCAPLSLEDLHVIDI